MITSRFLFLTTDESTKMTEAIHNKQREADALSGLIKKNKKGKDHRKAPYRPEAFKTPGRGQSFQSVSFLSHGEIREIPGTQHLIPAVEDFIQPSFLLPSMLVP